MTECERIIKEKVLPESFFLPETRDDYFIDVRMKKIWAVNMDMLMKFDSVCKKYGLKYFLAYGSLLGAIRHHGIVPWDDDMDVYMLREDYDKLMKLDYEFSSPYFLQTVESDPGYFFTYAKLRNSNTTCVTTQFRYQKINWGQNFDIFPLDNFEIDNGESIYKRIAELGTDLSNYMRSSNPNPDSAYEIERIKAYSGRNPLDIYKEVQDIALKYKNVDTKYVSCSSTYLYGFKKGVFYKEDFSRAIEWEVEGFKFWVPCGYDRILKTVYGNYLEFPPIEKRGCWHSNIYYDPDLSYKEYLKKIGVL